MVRVYINNFDDPEMIWSWDNGPGTEERHCRQVILACTSQTVSDLSKRGSKTEPCCWMQTNGNVKANVIPGDILIVERE